MPEDGLRERPAAAWRARPPARIGDFEIRAASNELAGAQGVIRLRPRLMDVLLRLAAEPGAVVPRQVLLDDVWPRRLVADEVLSRTIGELRTALGDDAREARYVETLPKIGYRLIAPVTSPVAPPPTPASVAPAPASFNGHARPFVPARPAQPVAAEPPGDTAPVTRPVAREATFRLHARIGARAAAALLVVAVAAAATWRLGREDAPPAVDGLERQLAGAGQFSSDLDMEMAPRFSPDGRRVAFALGNPEHARIVVQDVATRTRTFLPDTQGVQQNPVFFPDGQRLAYWRRLGTDCAIVERALAGGPERVLVDCSRTPGARFDLSPDGQQLVYASNGPGEVGLRLLDLRTGAQSPLTQPLPGDGIDVTPRFSPDGKRIAFLRGIGPQRSVWVLPVDRPEAAQAARSPRGISWGVAWLGNDGPLLVASDWFGGRALNVLDLATGHAALAGARGAQFPDVARNGDIVYELAAYQANLKLVDVRDPAAPARTLWPSARYSNYPEFSPDGARVVFLSNRDNAASLFVAELDGEARRVPLPAEHAFTQAHWSRDGTALYAVQSAMGPDREPSRGVRIDPTSGKVQVMPELGEWVVDLRESDDGATLYFATMEGSLMQLWRAPASAPAQRERLPLPKVDSYDLRGNRLAYAEPRARDIMVCTLPQLHCTPAGLPEGEPRTGWALGDGALWIGVYGEPGALLRYDLATHAFTTRLSHGPSAVGPNLAIAPGERSAIIARQERPAIDLMLAPRSGS